MTNFGFKRWRWRRKHPRGEKWTHSTWNEENGRATWNPFVKAILGRACGRKLNWNIVEIWLWGMAVEVSRDAGSIRARRRTRRNRKFCPNFVFSFTVDAKNETKSPWTPRPTVHRPIGREKRNNVQLHLTCFSVFLTSTSDLKQETKTCRERIEIPRCCTKNWLPFYPIHCLLLLSTEEKHNKQSSRARRNHELLTASATQLSVGR